jgi:hypothetical protein
MRWLLLSIQDRLELEDIRRRGENILCGIPIRTPNVTIRCTVWIYNEWSKKSGNVIWQFGDIGH